MLSNVNTSHTKTPLQKKQNIKPRYLKDQVKKIATPALNLQQTLQT
jgi:hypothetical protein